MKQHTKRALSILVAGVLLMGTISGCTPSAETPSPSGSTQPSPSASTAVTPPGEVEELGSGTVKWTEEKTADGWLKVTNEGGATLGYSPDSGVKLIQVDGFAFKDMNRNGKLDAYEDWRLEAEARAEDLAGQLTIDQIAGMMIHPIIFNVTDGADEMTETLDLYIRVMLNSARNHPVKTQANWNNSMQAYAESMDFGIPVHISTDPRTSPTWPNNLGLAATFDPNVALEAAKGMSKEYRALGIATLLGPQVDLSTDPRWPRTNGTFGEDPALSRDMTAASVAGHQSTYDSNGKDLGWGNDSVNAMLKHWPGDGAGESGRESHDFYGRYTVYPGGQFETALIPFIDGGFNPDSLAGAATSVMSSYSIAYSDDEEYGELVGSAFSEYKINLLRSYGFDGVICTDSGVVSGSTGHGVSDLNQAERTFKAIVAGVDTVMLFSVGAEQRDYVKEAYDLYVGEYGEEAALARFQNSARRILKVSFPVGIFENPYVDVAAAEKIVGGEEMTAAGHEAQLKSIVMVKNDDNTIHSADSSDEKPTVYIPMVYRAGYSGRSVVNSSASIPVDLTVAREYFNVVTDSISSTLTGPADADGNATIAHEDIIRATPAQLAECDYALVIVDSPANISYGLTSGGYDPNTETYIPRSLQYGEYVANSNSVRVESIAGDMVDVEYVSPYGTQIVKEKENRSYFGQTAQLTNASDLDTILYAVNNMPTDRKVIVAVNASNAMVVSEFEDKVDAILVGFTIQNEVFFDIVTGKVEPSGLLPLQMPASMEAVEKQLEDVPRDMECHVDADGNAYDFGFGMNWSGVIQDARTEKYCVEPLTAPEALAGK